MLVSFNTFDFNLFVKSDDINEIPPPNFSSYLKKPLTDSQPSVEQLEKSEDSEESLKKAFHSISQQNAYLEELNRSIQSKLDQEKKLSNQRKENEEKFKKELEHQTEKLKLLEEKYG